MRSPTPGGPYCVCSLFVTATVPAPKATLARPHHPPVVAPQGLLPRMEGVRVRTWTPPRVAGPQATQEEVVPKLDICAQTADILLLQELGSWDKPAEEDTLVGSSGR